MQLYGMDSRLIEIYNIRNLESVKVWEFVDVFGTESLIVPAILIVYDGGKNLNLCAKDEYFDLFVKKVMQVYQDEKKDILEDGLTDPFKLHTKIDIDETSKKILESGSLNNVSDIYSFYKGKDGFDVSFIFQIDEVNSLIDILKYHIMKLFTYTDQVVNFSSLGVTGYRNNYTMAGKINGIDIVFPLVYEKSDNNVYEFWVGGLIPSMQPVNVKIEFKPDGIYVYLNIEAYDLEANFKYSITNGMVKVIEDVMKSGITISYKNEDLEEEQDRSFINLANIDGTSKLKWFKLPWEAKYGINTVVTDLSEIEKIIEIHNMYVGVFNDGFVKKENYSKRYKRSRKEEIDGNDVVLDDVRKSVLGTCIDADGKLFVIETAFDKDNTKDGIINGVLTSEHYYHAALSDTGLKGLRKEILVPLGKRHIMSNSDLANRYKILNYVKGE